MGALNRGSAKPFVYLRQEGYVLVLLVGLSLSVGLLEEYWTDLHEIFTRGVSRAKE